MVAYQVGQQMACLVATYLSQFANLVSCSEASLVGHSEACLVAQWAVRSATSPGEHSAVDNPA